MGLRVTKMRVVEYGKENQDVIMLLHGGGLAPWNYKEEAEQLEDKFHILVPVLDGLLQQGPYRFLYAKNFLL